MKISPLGSSQSFLVLMSFHYNSFVANIDKVSRSFQALVSRSDHKCVLKAVVDDFMCVCIHVYIHTLIYIDQNTGKNILSQAELISSLFFYLVFLPLYFQ